MESTNYTIKSLLFQTLIKAAGCFVTDSGLLLASASSYAHTPGEQAKVYFKNLKDGDTISNNYKVEFGIEGYGIVPAGTKDKRRHTAGHHHLLIDHPGNLDMDEPLDHSRNCMHVRSG